MQINYLTMLKSKHSLIKQEIKECLDFCACLSILLCFGTG